MKVLYFLPGTGVGGIGKFVRDIVSHMPEDVEFTFITLGDPNSDLSVFLKENGKMLNFSGWGIAVLRALKKELKDGSYDLVHAHLGCWSFICLHYAKWAGVKKRIAHSHSADSFKTMNKVGKCVYALSKIINPFVVTQYFACSDHACEETFGRKIVKSGKYHRILNPVDERYFSPGQLDIRKEFGIPKECRVICHVGYMGYHKNHPFILSLAEKLRDSNIYWILVGDGHSRSQFEKRANDLQLTKILFLGIRSDIPDILKASDLFILPSLLEGLGTVVLEAQACGLPCVISENVTDETDMGLGLVKKIPLSDMQGWINTVTSTNRIEVDLSQIRQQFVRRRVEINSCVNYIYEIYNQ